MTSHAEASLRTASRAAVILIVDDTADLLELMAMALRRRHIVRLARNGFEALEVAAAMPTIDLLVSDLSMPHMGGMPLATHLRLTRPSLPVLFISGAPAGILPAVLPPHTSFLAKPFGVQSLVAAVEQALATSGRPTPRITPADNVDPSALY